MPEKQTKLEEYIENLQKLNETILGPALIENAYKIEIVNKFLTLEFSQKFDIELEFSKKFAGFHRCTYSGWNICMESEE